MQADLPFFESPEDALRAMVQALGGAKMVGSRLWPDRTPDSARTRLLDALNPTRSERLNLSESMFILRLAREAGLHEAFHWLAAEVGYEARPITRAEEVDRLTSVVESSSKTLAAALSTLERLQRVRVADSSARLG